MPPSIPGRFTPSVGEPSDAHQHHQRADIADDGVAQQLSGLLRRIQFKAPGQPCCKKIVNEKLNRIGNQLG